MTTDPETKWSKTWRTGLALLYGCAFGCMEFVRLSMRLAIKGKIMIYEALKVAAFIIVLVSLGMALQSLTNFIRPITWW